jgi:hypothetical protein
MQEHLSELFPRQMSALDGAPFSEVVRVAIEKAGSHGYTTERAVARYTELMFYFGAHFDQDPQAAWAQPFIDCPEDADQAERSGELHDEGMRQWGRMAGPDNVYLRGALKRLSEDPIALLKTASKPSPEEGLPEAFRRLYPEKVQAVGDEVLSRVVASGHEQAAIHGIQSIPGVVLFCGLMFALGTGFAADPILFWARDTLAGANGTDERTRVNALLRRAQEYCNLWSS